MTYDPNSDAPSSRAGPPSQPGEPAGTPHPAETPCPVVGVGASAGGLEAFTQLLRPLPAAPGLAFVLVQHLDPAHESLLATLLARVTRLPVREIQDGIPVAPNEVYVAPPQADVVIEGRVLHLIPRTDPQGLRMPIDRFFRSLAADQGPRAIGVILSGGGSDGALGLQDIKDHGGLTLVQEERTASVAGMPHSALMHGAVDVVAAPEGLARALLRMVRHPYVAAATPAGPEDAPAPGDEREAWGRILTLLRRATGVDFTAYKPGTIQRRMARRMALRNVEALADYATYLERHRDELEALYHELLIKVTTFFREPASFEALKREALPRLLERRPETQPLRLWVPGCATGEEAYSLAICVLEYLSAQGVQHPVRVFATDLDERALAKARASLYIENIALDVSAERLRRFFVRVDQSYQVSPAVRELCVFARHNLYRDPPFSHLDLISCRNVLIYLNAPTQRRVIPLLHYALEPHGVLTLGPSETIGGFTDLFTPLDAAHKIYTKHVTALPAGLDVFPRAEGPAAPATDLGTTSEPSPPWPTVDVTREAERLLLSTYAPAAVLVNAAMDILSFHGDTDRYLRPAQGKATWNLFRMARDGLLGDLRGALEQAQQSGVPVDRPGVRFGDEATPQEVTIRVLPLVLPAPAAAHYVVVFEAPSASALSPDPQGRQPPEARPPAAAAEWTNRLQQELEATRAYLQALMEQYEAANEELRAANEEVLSGNEELQSTNEELETAKEELQSMNEELRTTNDELQHRHSELSRAHADLTNLFASAALPLVMVDRDLRIRRFTDAAEAALPLIPTDVGRPIGHLQLQLALPDVEGVIRQVIDTDTPHVSEVQDREGRWYSLQIRPYYTPERRIDGAVLLLLDVSLLKDVDRLTRLLDDVGQAREYAESLLQTVPQPLLILDEALRVRTANEAFYRTFRLDPAAPTQRALYEVGDGQWDIPRLRELLEQIVPQAGEVRDFEVTHTFDPVGRRTMRLNARRLALENPTETIILLAIQDVTELRRTQDDLERALAERELLLRELHHRVKNNLQLVSSLLSLQADTLQHPAVRQAFEDSERRIQAMALVHDQLSTASGLSAIDVQAYVRRLATALVEAYAPDGRIGLHLEIEEGSVALDTAIPCALILTELLSNALEHAFPADLAGEVSVTWRRDSDDHRLLRVEDTGVGLPPEVDPAQPASLGLTIVQMLVEQLGGRLQVERAGGTTVTVRVPVTPGDERV
jgi:two-component system, chemotaxis family, CheB/CheR fusion protein